MIASRTEAPNAYKIRSDRISPLMNQEHLESLQEDPAFLAWQWSIAQLPQSARVNDVEDGPEEVLLSGQSTQ